MPTGGRHEQDPTAISERLQEALAALLGHRILEPNRDRVTAQLTMWDPFAASAAPDGPGRHGRRGRHDAQPARGRRHDREGSDP